MIIKIKPGFKSQLNFTFRVISKLRTLFYRPNANWRHTPVIINNYNRLDYLKKQVEWLEKAGLSNIYIIDNASTYPPLLNYYTQCPHTVFKLTENVGHTALWDTHIQLWFKNRYYIYTDPDVIPVENCPLNAVEYFYEVLARYPNITKVGFGLKIDDLPDTYERKQEVINWEQKFWMHEIEQDLYKARIDTTFALYRPNTRYQQWERTFRTGGAYVARHLPWYENSENPSEEEQFFRQVTTSVSSWYKDEEYNG